MENAFFTRAGNFCRRHPFFAAWAVIATTFLVRLAFTLSGQLDLSQDEAQYWDWSRTLQWSYYSKGPLVAFIIRFWTGIFGNTELGVRFGAMVNAAVLQWLLFHLVAGRWKRPDVALWMLFIGCTTPLFLASGLLMTTDNPLVLCWLGGMILLDVMAERGASALRCALLAFCVAAGILAKYMMLAFPVLALAYCLLLRPSLPGNFRRGLLWSLVVGTVLGFGPILIWNAQNGWVGFLHVTTLGGLTGAGKAPLLRLDTFFEFAAAQFGLLLPWWMLAILTGAYRAAGALVRGREAPYGLTRRRALLLVLFFAPIWFFFFFWSLHTRVYANWAAVSYVSGAVLAAFSWQAIWNAPGGRGWKKGVVILSLLVFPAIHVIGAAPLPESINPALRLQGWRDLGERIEEIKPELFPDPDNVFLFSEAYGVTAALSFYVPGQERAFCLKTPGRRLNQYDLWPGPQNPAGADALLVRKGREKGPPPIVKDLFERVGPSISFQSEHNGRPGLWFTLTPCYGFSGEWPQEGGRY